MLYSLSLRKAQTYYLALVFIVAGIVLPQICHATIPQGGLIFLPIYFFTLIAAYKYGMGVGTIVATLTPIINSIFFGMPPVAVLPIIMIKGLLLAAFAAGAAHLTKKVNFLALLAAVLAYQVVGCGIESLMMHDWVAGFQDFRIGIPGIALQIIGGYILLKYFLKK